MHSIRPLWWHCVCFQITLQLLMCSARPSPRSKMQKPRKEMIALLNPFHSSTELHLADIRPIALHTNYEQRYSPNRPLITFQPIGHHIAGPFIQPPLSPVLQIPVAGTNPIKQPGRNAIYGTGSAITMPGMALGYQNTMAYPLTTNTMQNSYNTFENFPHLTEDVSGKKNTFENFDSLFKDDKQKSSDLYFSHKHSSDSSSYGDVSPPYSYKRDHSGEDTYEYKFEKEIDNEFESKPDYDSDHSKSYSYKPKYFSSSREYQTQNEDIETEGIMNRSSKKEDKNKEKFESSTSDLPTQSYSNLKKNDNDEKNKSGSLNRINHETKSKLLRHTFGSSLITQKTDIENDSNEHETNGENVPLSNKDNNSYEESEEDNHGDLTSAGTNIPLKTDDPVQADSSLDTILPKAIQGIDKPSFSKKIFFQAALKKGKRVRRKANEINIQGLSRYDQNAQTVQKNVLKKWEEKKLKKNEDELDDEVNTENTNKYVSKSLDNEIKMKNAFTKEDDEVTSEGGDEEYFKEFKDIEDKKKHSNDFHYKTPKNSLKKVTSKAYSSDDDFAIFSQLFDIPKISKNADNYWDLNMDYKSFASDSFGKRKSEKDNDFNMDSPYLEYWDELKSGENSLKKIPTNKQQNNYEPSKVPVFSNVQVYPISIKKPVKNIKKNHSYKLDENGTDYLPSDPTNSSDQFNSSDNASDHSVDDQHHLSNQYNLDPHLGEEHLTEHHSSNAYTSDPTYSDSSSTDNASMEQQSNEPQLGESQSGEPQSGEPQSSEPQLTESHTSEPQSVDDSQSNQYSENTSEQYDQESQDSNESPDLADGNDSLSNRTSSIQVERKFNQSDFFSPTEGITYSYEEQTDQEASLKDAFDIPFTPLNHTNWQQIRTPSSALNLLMMAEKKNSLNLFKRLSSKPVRSMFTPKQKQLFASMSSLKYERPSDDKIKDTIVKSY